MIQVFQAISLAAKSTVFPITKIKSENNLEIVDAHSKNPTVWENMW